MSPHGEKMCLFLPDENLHSRLKTVDPRQTSPHLAWSSPSGLRLRMPWISSRMRQPAATESSRGLAFTRRPGGKKPLTAADVALTYPLPDSIGVVPPLVISGQHLLQHQQHAGDQAFVLSAAQLALKEGRCYLQYGGRTPFEGMRSHIF
ncbi:hypothetical protein EYF80_026878 [Liparis tanakae]|uniref:Uncharacterized protein n=1 Tax=Liparis tanakae TaxID=230148 RepID=A0A4Z2HAY5_9TELE|nr:hypothetical protein EYF80_026878 [Liparis tanakae]